MPQTIMLFYVPEAKVRFTKPEVKRMIACADRHDDPRCRAQSPCGGILWGLANQFLLDNDPGEWTDRTLSISEAALLVKVCETDAPDLSRQMSAIVGKLNKEFMRLNSKSFQPPVKGGLWEKIRGIFSKK